MTRSEPAQSLTGTRDLRRLSADAGLFHAFENLAPSRESGAGLRYRELRLAVPGSLQEAIDYASLHHGGRRVGLLLGMIAKHVRQHLGIEDAARRRDEGTEILLSVESIAEADAFGVDIDQR